MRCSGQSEGVQQQQIAGNGEAIPHLVQLMHRLANDEESKENPSKLIFSFVTV